jgi:hypothetical protein
VTNGASLAVSEGVEIEVHLLLERLAGGQAGLVCAAGALVPTFATLVIWKLKEHLLVPVVFLAKHRGFLLSWLRG